MRVHCISGLDWSENESDICRYAEVLETMHDGEHLSKYEDLLEAAIDLDRIPDEYLIAPTYDSGLEVRACQTPGAILGGDTLRQQNRPEGLCSLYPSIHTSKLRCNASCVYSIKVSPEVT